MVTRSRFVSTGGAGDYVLRHGDGTDAFTGTPPTSFALEDGRYHQWTTADQLEWNTTAGMSPPVYETVVGGADVSGLDALSLRVAQRFGAVGSDTDLNFTVQLIDSSGNEATVQTSQLANVTRSVDRAPGHPNFSDFDKAHFVTVRIPLNVFTTNGTQVDLSNIQSVRFVFDQRSRGTVALDDIVFENNQ